MIESVIKEAQIKRCGIMVINLNVLILFWLTGIGNNALRTGAVTIFIHRYCIRRNMIELELLVRAVNWRLGKRVGDWKYKD
jgi:hypothetical protein